MLPIDKLRIVIHNSDGPLRTDKFMKHVMMEMYRIVIWEMKTSADLEVWRPQKNQTGDLFLPLSENMLLDLSILTFLFCVIEEEKIADIYIYLSHKYPFLL